MTPTDRRRREAILRKRYGPSMRDERSYAQLQTTTGPLRQAGDSPADRHRAAMAEPLIDDEHATYARRVQLASRGYTLDRPSVDDPKPPA